MAETGRQRMADPPPAIDPTASLIAVAGEQCTACGARLATDQRYCLECGERRGESRVPVPEARRTAPAPAPRPRPRLSSGATLIAGIGTLLIAMAVGVLIGRSGQRPVTPASAPVRLVTVPAAGATATPTAATTAATAVAKQKKKPAKGAKAKATATPVAQKTPPPTVKIGQKGRGRGYKNGKFTGDFFGP